MLKSTFSMGALTLKSFPFILRSWNIKSYQSFDPTDSFGQDTLVYVNKNQIIKIEPQLSNTALSLWLTDKGRLFFDSFFRKTVSNNNILNVSSDSENKQWSDYFRIIIKNFYIFDLCNFKDVNKFFFIFVFENIGTEITSFLSLVSNLNPFIKIKRAEKNFVDSNLESNFQINSVTSYTNLSASSLCLLIGVNTRYESSYLNLKLRQRYLKGNFKVLLFGSFIDLTFPVSFISSTSFILKNFVEGNHIFCKDLISSYNPFIIANTESLKRNSIREYLYILKNSKYLNVLTEVWNGLNLLNSSLYETGVNSFSRFSFLTSKDLLFFSSFYSLNVNLKNISNVNSVTESRLLKLKDFSRFLNVKVSIVQSVFDVSEFGLLKKYLYVPNSAFFENQDSFLNAEGFRKVGSQLILKKKKKSDWQILRKLCQDLNNQNYIVYSSNSLFNFKLFINFQFQPTKSLISFDDGVIVANQKFVIYKQFSHFKNLIAKIFFSPVNFWLTDFYLGGKDSFCLMSPSLVRCGLHTKQTLKTFI